MTNEQLEKEASKRIYKACGIENNGEKIPYAIWKYHKFDIFNIISDMIMEEGECNNA